MPNTPLLFRRFLVSVMVNIVAQFLSVRIVDTEQRSGERCDLTERDEERLMDLPFGVDERPAEEQHHTAYREEGCRDELYVQIDF